MYYESIRALRSIVFTELYSKKNTKTVTQLASWKGLVRFLSTIQTKCVFFDC